MHWVLLLTLLQLFVAHAPTVAGLSSLTAKPAALKAVPILPARQPLSTFVNDDNNNNDNNNNDDDDQEKFSVLSWNILLPNSVDKNSNWWCHKQYASWVDPNKRQWPHRHALIQQRLLDSQADIICIQEVDGDTFEDDFRFLQEAGYDHVVHTKFRFRCATFYSTHKYTLEQAAANKDRTLLTALRCKKGNPSRILTIVNCHLSGGAAPERRLRQVHNGLDQIRKWRNARQQVLDKLQKGNSKHGNNNKNRFAKQIKKAAQDLEDFEAGGVMVVGDFNSDGETAVRKLLVEGCVDSEWHEPQYPTLKLTSKPKEQSLGSFVDAAELAYQSNVCDGDYSDLEVSSTTATTATTTARPATYVVPNLASLLLLPIDSNTSARPTPRTEFGPQVARGIAETLNLQDFCEMEMDRAFAQVDDDGNGWIDAEEVQTLLEQAYVATYGQQMEQERNTFFRGFGGGTKNNTNNTATLGNDDDDDGLTKKQFTARLKALQQDQEGERKAFGLAKGLDLHQLDETEMEQAFDRMDLDGNGLLDEDEYQQLLETVYVAIHGEEIEKQKTEFFLGFQKKSGATTTTTTNNEELLSKELFTDRLLALHQELEGGRKGAQLAEVRTEADAQQVVERFTPLLQNALDQVFDKFCCSSNDGENEDDDDDTALMMTQEQVNDFLKKTNGVLGRGGTHRHTSAILTKKMEASKPAVLTRQDWYGVFARELAEGKWWQVVYDLEMCGANLRTRSSSQQEHYQAWLDYVYFDSERFACAGVQDVLTETERSLVYSDGDALPNEWHPSDHLPVAAVFSWK